MEIKVPEVGESVHEATIAKWHKQDGEAVHKDDLLCELETDKITLELNADGDGVLAIEIGEGESVDVGAVIGRIEEGAAPAEEKPAAEMKPEKKEEKRPEETKEGKKAERKTPAPAEAPPPATAARREAREEKREEARRETPPPRPKRRRPRRKDGSPGSR